MFTHEQPHGNLASIPGDILDYKEYLTPKWPKAIAALRASGVPLNLEGEGEGEGSSGEGGGGGESGGEGEGSGAGSSGEGSGGSEGEGSSDSGGSGDNGSAGGGTGDPPSGQSQIPTSELQRLRRIARESDEAEKKRKKEQEEELRKKKREEGRWQELLQEEQEKTTAAEKERDEARGELRDFRRAINIEKVAKRLGFKDPSDAVHYLEEEDKDDDKLIEAALKRVAKEKSYLVNPKKATGGPGPDNGQGGLTVEDVKKMPQEEINRRWSEVSKVLQESGQR